MEGRTAYLTALAVALVVGCGGENTAGPQHAQPPPREVLAMSVHVNGGGGDDVFCPAFEAGLARSGIPITGDPRQPSDVELTCHVNVSEAGSFWVVNGQTKKHYTIRIEVKTASGKWVDQFIASYNAYPGGEADEDAVGKAVLAYAYSPRIANYARVKNTMAAASPPADTSAAIPAISNAGAGTGAPPSNDPRDDAEWFRIDTVRCKIPARPDACNQVRSYLSHRPNGAHAQEAQDILNAAEPALEKLQKDDVAWQKAGISECRTKRTADACAGVEAYEIQFPTGMHADDAHRMLKAAGIDK